MTTQSQPTNTGGKTMAGEHAPGPVTLAEAKLFLRVEHEDHDDLIQTLIDMAQDRVEGEVGLTLTDTSPAPLRLALLMLTLRAYERGDASMPLTAVNAWVAPYRTGSPS